MLTSRKPKFDQTMRKRFGILRGFHAEQREHPKQEMPSRKEEK